MSTIAKKICLIALLVACVLGIILFFVEANKKNQPATPSMQTQSASTPLSNQIIVDIPSPNETIKNAVTVSGMARGPWYFEGSFPVRLIDANGKELARGIAKAQGEWTTELFVPFIAPLTFPQSTTETGILILEKDNPSGLAEHAGELRVPIRFTAPGRPHTCRVTGCSGQLCADTEITTTCEYFPAYTCYKEGTCARQKDGVCGWTETPALKLCLESTKKHNQ